MEWCTYGSSLLIATSSLVWNLVPEGTTFFIWGMRYKFDGASKEGEAEGQIHIYEVWSW